ncbi:uncharacterized protein TNCT_219271 [Trichonephila clavata]|uniref:Uncharacterized protein n=1 Tax=Trichonephila clavata TaxID=2740835 RepID=A0A8X6LL51_TRICU|nr:uncharacterized protein TNCT_219271 [Trichonephila clavata]
MLLISENSAKTSKSFDPAKESKSWSEQTITANQSPAAPKSSSPVLTNHSTSTSTSTTTTTSTTDSVSAAPAVCDGDCGNIMCSLSPACIEEIFDDPKKPDKTNCTSPVEPPSDEASEDGSLRRRTKSEGCYSTTYRCKSGKKSSPSLDSSRELLSPPAQDDSDEVDTAPSEANRISHSSSSSTWSGRVRDLKREVKHRICRLRSPKSSNPTQVPNSF